MALANSSGSSAHLGRRLEGKVAVITGGSMGIEEVTAKVFCLQGAKVGITDIEDDLGRAVCAAIGSNDIATFIHCDVSKESDVLNAVDFTVSKYGKLDIMFNNAAILERQCSRIMDIELSGFERAMSTNCTGVFLGIKHAARAMVAVGTMGSIINNESVCTIIWGMAAHGYVVAKHAVVGLTKDAAAELGQYGIRVNCISPFLTFSLLTKDVYGRDSKTLEKWIYGMANLKGRGVLKAEDTAQAAVYFSSDESKYVSGQNFVIDGGYTSVNNNFGLFKQHT